MPGIPFPAAKVAPACRAPTRAGPQAMLPRRVRSTGMAAFYAVTSLAGNLGPLLVRAGVRARPAARPAPT
jgi:hypothetical protein